MLSRSAVRGSGRAVRCLQCVQKRGLAAPASGSFTYQTGEVAGVKFASRDLTHPTTTLAIVSKAGTRYQFLPGLAEGLEKFAFKNTQRRSALRITREMELLGAQPYSYHTRESLVVGAKFLREDLPYFIELLSEVASKTEYQHYILDEEVLPSIKLYHKKYLADTEAMAFDSAHGVAFHSGLGVPVRPSSSTPMTKYLSVDSIQDYAAAAYAKPNFAVVANGADHAELNKWVGEFFKDYSQPAIEGLPKIESQQAKYHGGEERIAHDRSNTMVLAFPGSSSFTGGFYKPEIQVLASLLGGETSVKWSPGFSLLSKAVSAFAGAHIKTKSVIYPDAGLLAITIKGSAPDVRNAAGAAVQTLKDVAAGKASKEDIKKAIATAKFKELEFGQNVDAGIELTGSGLVSGGKAYQIDEVAKAIDGVTAEQVKAAAQTALESKASVSAVGDLFVLPWAEDLGLNV